MSWLYFERKAKIKSDEKERRRVMGKFSQRSTAIEIMDDLNCSGEVVDQTLRELEFINRTLGGNAVTVDGVSQLLRNNKSNTLSIIDLGCGGGDMLKLLQRKLPPGTTFKGVDANPNIVQYAITHSDQYPVIRFAPIDILSDEFKRESCDIALATLFFHHFTDDQLVEILTHLNKQVRVGIVINDLHRHPLAYYSIKILTRVFSKSSMVKFDAPLSVLRGFSKKELSALLHQAGIRDYTIKWKWAFRWQIVAKA